MRYMNLNIIGTSHISKESKVIVESTIKREKPDVIALELDRRRAFLLMHGEKKKAGIGAIIKIGVKGYIFSLIGAWAEKKLGEQVGMKPGDEMKTALKTAKKEELKIAFIDQDIEVTLRKFSKKLTWKEKWNFFVDVFKAIVLRKKEIEFDIKKVPDKKTIKKMLKKVKERYPNIYTVLIAERNLHMAKKLFRLMVNNSEKRILAVVGAGHEDEIIRIIKGMATNDISYSFSVS